MVEKKESIAPIKKPFFSVITPVYNAECYLLEALQSLQQQTFEEVEFILIDDGSTDHSAEICRSFVKEDSRFILLEKENGGPGSARNMGLRVANGSWVCFFDSDDVLLSKRALATLAEKIKELKCDCLRFEYKALSEKGDVLWDEVERVPRKEVFCDKVLSPLVFTREIIQNDFFSWLLTIRKEIIDQHKITFPEELSYVEDIHFYLQLLPHLNRCLYMPYSVYGYRKRNNSLSYQKNHEEKIECYGLLLALLGQGRDQEREEVLEVYYSIVKRVYTTFLYFLGTTAFSYQKRKIRE